MFGVPIEYLMFGGIGFCLAWLTALMVVPAVHHRATRLARERYDTVPLSIKEIRAEKDSMRAGFATATRELEVRIDALRHKTVAHASDMAKKNQLIERLKQEVENSTSTLRESESRVQAVREELRESRRNFASKDTTLGTVEGQIADMQHDLAGKDTALQAARRDIAAIRSEMTTREQALREAETERAGLRDTLSSRDREIAKLGKQVASLEQSLHESTERDQAAREELRTARHHSAQQDTGLGVAEGEAVTLRASLAARDTALQAGERDIAALRSELAGKDAALSRAEREITAIRAEISALTTLLVQTGSDAPRRPERQSPSVKIVEVVSHITPLRAPPPQATSDIAQPGPAANATSLAPHEVGARGDQRRTERPALRAPVDVIPAPTRLVPPSMSKTHQNEDGIVRAVTEISDAADRVEERQSGQNQKLRAAYAPLAKTSS